MIQIGRLKSYSTLIQCESNGVEKAAIRIVKALDAKIIITVRNTIKARAGLKLETDKTIQYP
ncbi:MAG: hypothetical protein ABI045_06815 [Flavobacteriales bacterium]